jgi:hypothetical protein
VIVLRAHKCRATGALLATLPAKEHCPPRLKILAKPHRFSAVIACLRILPGFRLASSRRHLLEGDMAWIKLTLLHDGIGILVNTDHITSITPAESGNAVIAFSGQQSLSVEETPENIETRLHATKHTMI